jgi:hypothetical protein
MKKNTVIWKCPSPSSGFLNGVDLTFLGKRECRLVFQYEDEVSEGVKIASLSFLNTIAFRCTYLPALTVEMIESSYDRLIEVGMSDWLMNATETMGNRQFDFPVKHLQICFDDGPCYEFLCESFQVQLGRA